MLADRHFISLRFIGERYSQTRMPDLSRGVCLAAATVIVAQREFHSPGNRVGTIPGSKLETCLVYC